jgi:hypothetical protein
MSDTISFLGMAKNYDFSISLIVYSINYALSFKFTDKNKE